MPEAGATSASSSYFDSIGHGLQAAHDVGEMMRELDRVATVSATQISQAVAQSQSHSAAAKAFTTRRDYLPQGGKARKELDTLLEQKKVRLIIVGEVSSGKSTLWNAILGTEIFPEAVEACTKRVAVVEYSAKPYIKLVPPDGMSEDDVQRIEKFGAKVSEALAASSSTELPEEVGARKELDDPALKEPLERVEQMMVGIPNDLLKLGLIAIDSPGLNETASLTARTLEEMKKADNVLYVLNASAGGFTQNTALSLKTAVSSIGSSQTEWNPLFILNKIDSIKEPYDEYDTDEERMEKDALYRKNLDTMCKATYDNIKNFADSYPNVLQDVNESTDYENCRTFHALSAKQALNASKRGRRMAPTWIQFSDAFNTFAQETLFVPLHRAGVKVGEYGEIAREAELYPLPRSSLRFRHDQPLLTLAQPSCALPSGSTFVDQLLEDQNAEQHAVIEDLLENKIPKALEEARLMEDSFKWSVIARYRGPLEQTLSSVLVQLQSDYLLWAQEWTGTLERENRANITPKEKDQYAAMLLDNLQLRLMNALSQQKPVQDQLSKIEAEFNQQTQKIIDLLKNVSNEFGSQPETKKFLAGLVDVSYAPDQAVPKRTFVRKHRVKIMVPVGVVTVGMGALAMYAAGAGQSPPWHKTKEWIDFKKVAAETFYKKLDVKELTTKYIENLEATSHAKMKAFQDRVKTAEETIKEMKDVNVKDLPQEVVAKLTRTVDLAHLTNESIRSIKDRRINPVSLESQKCSIYFPVRVDVAAVQLKIAEASGQDYDAVKMVLMWKPASMDEAQLQLEKVLRAVTQGPSTSTLALVPFQAPPEYEPSQISLEDLAIIDAPQSPCRPVSLDKANVVMLIMKGTPEAITRRLTVLAVQGSASATSADAEKADDKYQAKVLRLGPSKESALGVAVAVGLSHAELAAGLVKGEQAIVDEFKTHGSSSDKANLMYIMYGTALKEEDMPHHVKDEIASMKYHGGSLEPDDFDFGHAGMTLADFLEHEYSRIAGLQRPHVLALRLYTASSYTCFNRPLRNEQKPHPFAMSVYFLADAVKKLRAVAAELDPEGFMTEKVLWRGMQDLTVDHDKFSREGGSERAPMSTSSSISVALNYAASKTPLVFKYKTRGNGRGVPISYLSMYPKEEEYLYPPLTLLVPEGPIQEHEYNGQVYKIIEVTPMMP